jgi:hypothetical protein
MRTWNSFYYVLFYGQGGPREPFDLVDTLILFQNQPFKIKRRLRRKGAQVVIVLLSPGEKKN